MEEVGPEDVKATRQRSAEKWKRRARQLDKEEIALARKAPKELWACWAGPTSDADLRRGVWRGKRTLLMEEMAREAGVPHAERLSQYMREGFHIFGEAPSDRPLQGRRDPCD